MGHRSVETDPKGDLLKKSKLKPGAVSHLSELFFLRDAHSGIFSWCSLSCSDLCCLGLFCGLWAGCNCSKSLTKSISSGCGFYVFCLHQILSWHTRRAYLLCTTAFCGQTKNNFCAYFFFFPTPPIFPLLGAELTEWKLKVEICVEPRISCYWNSLQTTEEWLCRGNKGEKVTKRSCCTILCIACGGDYIQTSVFSLSSSNLAFFSVFFHQTYQVWYIYQMKLSGVVLFRA